MFPYFFLRTDQPTDIWDYRRSLLELKKQFPFAPVVRLVIFSLDRTTDAILILQLNTIIYCAYSVSYPADGWLDGSAGHNANPNFAGVSAELYNKQFDTSGIYYSRCIGVFSPGGFSSYHSLPLNLAPESHKIWPDPPNNYFLFHFRAIIF